MKIAELLIETATAGSTNTSMNPGLGGSPHVLGGSPAVLRRWSGSPGKTGKSIKHKPPKAQSAKDNPVTNTGVGKGLIA